MSAPDEDRWERYRSASAAVDTSAAEAQASERRSWERRRGNVFAALLGATATFGAFLLVGLPTENFVIASAAAGIVGALGCALFPNRWGSITFGQIGLFLSAAWIVTSKASEEVASAGGGACIGCGLIIFVALGAALLFLGVNQLASGIRWPRRRRKQG